MVKSSRSLRSRRNTLPPIFSVLPRHILNTHVLPKLPNADAVHWAMTRREEYRTLRPNLLRRRDSKEEELQDVVHTFATIFSEASKHADGAARAKHSIDALPPNRYAVTRSALTFGPPFPSPEATFACTVSTPHFTVDAEISIQDVDGMVWSLDGSLLITSKQGTKPWAKVELWLDRPRLTTRGFPREWLSIIEREMGLRRSARRTRQRR